MHHGQTTSEVMLMLYVDMAAAEKRRGVGVIRINFPFFVVLPPIDG